MITSPGIGSGLDIESLVSQLVTLEGQVPAERFARREAGFQAELSGLGSYRSALDNLRSALEPLKNLNDFGARIASSSDEELFTVSVDSTVVPNDYDIEVISLAKAQKRSSAAYVDAATSIGTGTLEISIDPTAEDGGTISIDILDDEFSTLADIRNAINNAEGNPGVTASIVNAEDGAHLILTGTKTGVKKTIEVTVTPGGFGDLAGLFDNMTVTQAAADAEIAIDSFSHFSATNRVTGAIDGMTIDLHSADPGTTASLVVELDVNNARDLVESFVDAYNALRTTTNDLTRYNPETKEAGFLQGRSIVSSLLDRLSREFNQTVLGPLTSVRDLGMSIALDGSIELDDDALDAMLATKFTDVGNLFADTTDGAAVRFDALLDEYLKTDGFLDVRTDGLKTSIEVINVSRERLDQHLVAVEARLRTQFLGLDQLISQLNSTSGFLSAQLSNLVSPTALLGN